MAEALVYLNGSLVPESEASLKIYDAGVVIGATVTEMTRTFHHKPFRLEDHLARLRRSLKFTRLDSGLTTQEMLDISNELVEHNASLLPEDVELGLIHFVTPGEFKVYAGSAVAQVEKPKPTVCMHTFPLALWLWADYFRVGAHVITPSIRHIPPQCIDPKMKYRSRMHWYLADQETHLADPKGVTLLLDLDGNLTETSGANFLLANGGTILSPTTRNVLPGISRMAVMEFCDELGIPFVERDLQVHDAMNADEAFLATTPYCLAPVTRFNGVTIADGKPGPLFTRLIERWSKDVEVDIVKQILEAKAPA